MSIPTKLLLPLLLIPLLAGCEQASEVLGLPNPGKEAAIAEAEGKAVGGACRLAGRSLEDCYVLNPAAPKAAVLAGWKDMNDYMMQNKVEVIPSRLPPPTLLLPRPRGDGEDGAGETADRTAETTDQAAEEEKPRRRPRR